MAKQPETIDRFRIVAEDVEPEQVGSVLAALARLGVSKVGYEMVTDVRSFANNRQNGARDAVLAFAAARETFRVAEVRAHFEAEGRNVATAQTTVSQLAVAGKLQRIEEGRYRLTPLMLSPPVEEQSPNEPKPKLKRGVFQVSGAEAIWNAFKKRKTIRTKDVAELFASQGRKVKSTSGAISLLSNMKIITKKATGEYELTGTVPTFNNRLHPKTKKPTAKLNGTHANGETPTHG